MRLKCKDLFFSLPLWSDRKCPHKHTTPVSCRCTALGATLLTSALASFGGHTQHRFMLLHLVLFISIHMGLWKHTNLTVWNLIAGRVCKKENRVTRNTRSGMTRCCVMSFRHVTLLTVFHTLLSITYPNHLTCSFTLFNVMQLWSLQVAHSH